MDERARHRRQRLHTRRFASNVEADLAERQPWPTLTDEERVELAWKLSEETWPLGPARMNDDFVDLLRAFSEADVRFLVVGA
jgi:hypothetical protein